MVLVSFHEMPITLTWSRRYSSAMGACSIATKWREVLGLLKDADSLTVGLGQVLCDNRVWSWNKSEKCSCFQHG